ncbi:ABC transporter permease [Rhizobium halophilum]|uniref:ABC transporter permease n=1 Tax=Rhizobium halophilum TaxID=2846852 RepID=UPI001EFE4759|nr:ABC transporter permease [Rhizobium halophilum]MCF6368405.1 ABC transporter permease [Rhizobium halophilum]
MSGLFSAIATALDPLCGPVGIFTLLGGGGMLSCGANGWGDEIAFGVKVTITLALATLPIGLLLGFLIALAAQSEDKLLRAAVGIYTTIFRGLPELLTLFIVYYGLQLLIQALLAWLGIEQRIEINAFLAGMIALAVVFSSYSSEVLLSAFRAIPKGQYEAGDALGMRRSRTMLLVVLPQLIRIALPGLGNLWMILLKDTSYVSIIGLSDIVRQTSVAARVSKEAFFFYFLACLLYLALAVLSSVGLGFIERWSRRGEARR